MSLTLGRQGGIAQPLKKRTVGQINIAHVYDGANHIWPTSVIHFSDFTSVQLRYIWGSDDGRDLDTKSYYVNVLGATAGSGSGAPTAFQAWEKSCEDTLALQGGLY